MDLDDYMNCRTDDGVTVGLIDGIIAIARVLAKRDLSSQGIKEALLDLQQDEDIAFLLNNRKEK